MVTAPLLRCPPTQWDTTRAAAALPSRQAVRKLPEVRVPIADEESWLSEHADEMRRLLDQAGALHFRGLSLTKTKPGFRRFCCALSLQPCQDPLSSIGVRSLLSPADGVCEPTGSLTCMTYPALSHPFALSTAFFVTIQMRRSTQQRRRRLISACTTTRPSS